MKNAWVRWTVLILGGLVAAALLGAGLLAYLVSRLDVKGEIERVVENATGRQLTINGSVGVSFWPVLGLQADDASLSNVQGGRAPALAAMERINVGVEIRPLFNRDVIVRQLVLQKPRIALEIDAQGRPNWILRPAPAPAPQRPTSSHAPAAPTRASQFTLRDVRINDGEISFYDARRGSTWLVGEVNLKSALTSLTEPVNIEGDVKFNDHKVDLHVQVAQPGAIFAGRPVAITADVSSDLLNATFNGNTTASAGEIDGNVQASGPSLRQFSAWVGAPIQGGVGFEHFAVTGHVGVSAGAFDFSNAGFALDLIRGRGDFVLSQRHGKPYLSGRLELFDFDLNPYLSGQAPPPAATATVTAPTTAPTTQAPTASIAAVRAPARALDVQAAPSGRPIDFSGLRSINADLELVTAAVLIQHMRIDNARLNLVVNDGYLAATMQNISLYGGSGRGRFEVDARDPVAHMVQDMTFSGIDTRRFLTDAVNFNNIEGRGEITLNLRQEGRTQSELIASADGAMHVEVVSGVLHGLDLGGVSRTIRNALRGELIAPEAQTPLTGLSASFDIADGVLASDNISINTRELRAPGVGAIDLVQHRLDLRLAPRAQRGGLIVFPFVVRGPFAHLTYDSDIRDRAKTEIDARVRAVKAAARAQRAH